MINWRLRKKHKGYRLVQVYSNAIHIASNLCFFIAKNGALIDPLNETFLDFQFLVAS